MAFLPIAHNYVEERPHDPLENPLIGAALAPLFVTSLASSAFAYGPANYQITFSGTGTAPGVGGTGFRG